VKGDCRSLALLSAVALGCAPKIGNDTARILVWKVFLQSDILMWICPTNNKKVVRYGTG
jgi:hypothetical protein